MKISGRILWAVFAALFVLRAALPLFSGDLNLFYNDSASHLLHGFWTTLGWSRSYPWAVAPTDVFIGWLHGTGANILEANLIVRVSIAAVAYAMLVDSMRRWFDCQTALAAALLLLALPSSARLMHSAQPGLFGFCALAAALWTSSLKRGPAFDLIAAGLLAGAFWYRPEFGVYLVGFCVWKAFEHRTRPVWAATLLGIMVFGLMHKASGTVSFGTRVAADFNLGAGPSSMDLFMATPKFLMLSVPLFSAFSAWGFFRAFQGRNPALKVWSTLALLQSLALWIMAARGFHSWESDRIWHTVLSLGLLAAAPWAVELFQRQRNAAFAWIAALLLFSPTGKPETGMIERTLEARNAGREVSKLAPEGLILIEVHDPSWPDAAIFTLAPERVRTLPVKNYGFAKAGKWDGVEPVATRISIPTR